MSTSDLGAPSSTARIWCSTCGRYWDPALDGKHYCNSTLAPQTANTLLFQILRELCAIKDLLMEKK